MWTFLSGYPILLLCDPQWELSLSGWEKERLPFPLPILLCKHYFLKFLLIKDHNCYSNANISEEKKQKCWLRFTLRVNSLSDLFQGVGSDSFRLHGREKSTGKRKTKVASFMLLEAPCLWILLESLPDQFPWNLFWALSQPQRQIHPHHLSPPPSARSGRSQPSLCQTQLSFVPACLSEAALMG